MSSACCAGDEADGADMPPRFPALGDFSRCRPKGPDVHILPFMLLLWAITIVGAGGAYLDLRRLMTVTASTDTQLTTIVTKLVTDTQQVITDVLALLKQGSTDPVVAQAVLALQGLDSNLNAVDGQVQAVINPPPPPASGVGVVPPATS
jgi:hypothetical protein